MVEQQFVTPQPVRVEIRLTSADVEISTIDGEESKVSLDGSDKQLDATRVELVGDRLIVEQQRRSIFDWLGRAEGSLHVRALVPHHATVEILNAAGESRLDGSFEDVDLRTASGNLRVSGEVQGDVAVKTVSGDVRVPRVGGDLRVHSVSGAVNAESVGGSLAVKSVSGSVRVGSMREGRAEVQCVAGDIELGIARGTNFNVDASSASGNLSSEIPLGEESPSEPGPTLIVRGNTVSGSIRLFRAAASD